MTDPVVTDATKVLTDNKATIATLEGDVAKVKVFWLDYRAYLVCLACFLAGAFVHKLW